LAWLVHPQRAIRALRSSGMVRRAAWGVLDQALSSLTNFLLAIFVARTVGVDDFGAFSIAFATYLVFLSVSRSLATLPLTMRYSATSDANWRRATSAATGTALSFGAMSALAVLLVGFLLGGTVGGALAVFGIGLVPLLVQDAWRFAFFAVHRGKSAFANDLVWAIALVPGVIFVQAVLQPSTVAWILVWWSAAGVGAIFGIWQAKLLPRPGLALGWLREHRSLTPRLVAESLVLTGTSYVTVLAIAGVSGLRAVAGVRAAQVLMNATNVAIFGAQLFALPEAVEIGRRSLAHLERFCLLVGGVLFVVSLGWGGILLALPNSVGQALLGQTWESAAPLILPIALLSGMQGLSMGAFVGLRALALVRQSLRARIATSVFQLVGGAGGARVAEAAGAAWGMMVAAAAGVVIWWYQLLTAVRRQVDGAAETLLAATSEGRETTTGEGFGV
jgi:O-antigen/teichoic acid export membrane protein